VYYLFALEGLRAQYKALKERIVRDNS